MGDEYMRENKLFFIYDLLFLEFGGWEGLYFGFEIGFVVFLV